MFPKTGLRRHLFSLTGPIFIETLLVMVLGFMDVLMLSQVSDTVVASVGFVNMLLMTTYMLFMVGTTGASVVCSQYIGAGQQENFTQSVGAALIFNLLMGAVTSLIFFFCSKEILLLMDIRPELLDSSFQYATIAGAGSLFVSINMALSVVLRSCNFSHYPMYVSLVVNICNIIGNYTLIFGKFGFPALGVEGAALSTVCSRFVAFLMLCYMLKRRALKLPLLPQIFPLSSALIDKFKKILFIGLPSAGEMLSYTLSQLCIMYFINQLGTESVAARTYLVNLIMFTFVFAISIGQGSSIAVGQLIGKKKHRASLLLGKYSIRVAIYVSVSLSVLLALISPFILPLMTQNPQILAICLIIFWIDIPLEVGRAVNILAGKLLGAVGNPQYPFYVGIIFMWLVATLGGYILGLELHYGLMGMWIAFTFDECIRAGFLWHRWNSEKWKNRGFVK